MVLFEMQTGIRPRIRCDRPLPKIIMLCRGSHQHCDQADQDDTMILLQTWDGPATNRTKKETSEPHPPSRISLPDPFRARASSSVPVVIE